MSNKKQSTKEIIEHYQRSIERNHKREDRLLHCISRLDAIPIKVQHLQETGIGRTVNNLRKYDGTVGEEAKNLVNKWKNVVAANATDTEEEAIDDAVDDVHDDVAVDEDLDEDQAVDDDADDDGHVEPDRSRDSDDRRSKHSQKHHRLKEDRHETDRPDKGHRRSDKHDERKSHANSVAEPSSHSVKHKKRSRDNAEPLPPHEAPKSKKQRAESSTSSLDTTSQTLAENNEKAERSRRSERPDKSAKSSKSDKSKKSKRKSTDGGFEIDNSMGTSFADALGMLAPAPSASSSKSFGSTASSSKPSAKASHSSAEQSASHVSSKHSKHKETAAAAAAAASTSTSNVSAVSNVSNASNVSNVSKASSASSSASSSATPALLQQKPQQPLEDISHELMNTSESSIMTDYRPMPLNPMVMDCVYRPSARQAPQFHEDALCASTTSKNMRTKVYSGVKTGAKQVVPTLYETAIRFLQRNVDSIEYTGGIPYQVIQPVLVRTTAEQLSTFEHFNPYIMEDSGHLWEAHCKRKFRTAHREEMESWREMYVRCTREQDERLSDLANKHKNAQRVAVPMRQTKLAYVDSMVKPPRNVIKRQNVHGTHKQITCTPAARVESLSSGQANMASPGDVRLKTVALLRQTVPPKPPNGAKPRKAPLMAKTLQFMKGRLRR